MGRFVYLYSMRDGSQQTGFIEQLILRETPSAYRVAMSLTHNPEDSKELVQEASYRLLQQKHRCDVTRDGRAWFKVVVRNLFIDSRRSAARRHGVSLDCPIVSDGISLAESLPNPEPGIEVRCEREEERRSVRRIVRRLRPEQKEALMLCDMRDLSYKEAARTLSLPVGTFRSRLKRARQSFRSLWIKEQLTNA